MKLATGDSSWPLLSNEQALDLAALLDFEGVDVCRDLARAVIAEESAPAAA